ncbi:hypothetical protein TBLA_0B07890 [Henningerozyma blattae CBS 6284]|uniref:Mitochondrial carrier protein n=1 Tax=Henningerozyma blattae (strain ATCC 34711 / CBS 6284 / DSM 70876 / NBRC 10599 / NRRL Y-10934 / UCD 77-7) TaxID=1071380 RepID=I2GZQ3_HENB6|nr:hypothetical protein TBLA_0B07890 [Tetrapisispora blattae CBS 6284]CCH59605.1 hypothetical protein TBLA_0B07890 [Tetrapisispora blattae CBS 6284]
MASSTSTIKEQTSLGLSQRMVSAMAGSLVTALLVTPLDVVRIRLQQQHLLPECTCVNPTIIDPPVVKNIRPVTNLASIGPSNAIFPSVSTSTFNDAITAGKLFWEAPCFKDLGCTKVSSHYRGTWSAVQGIARSEGTLALWRGLSLTLVMAVPANVVYYAGYEYVRDWSPLGQSYPTLNPALCGASARVLAATCIAPLELLKTRLQSVPKAQKSHLTNLPQNNKSIVGSRQFDLFKDLLKETGRELRVEGPTALFRGLTITLWRDVPFSAIYWASYEKFKKLLSMQQCTINTGRTNYTECPGNGNNSQGSVGCFLKSFLGGCISGSIAALFTHPFDVGKTRMQIVLNSPTAVSSATKATNNNMFLFLWSIKKTEGFSALFTGLVPRLLKIAPSCAIMISTYEVSKKILGIET